MLFVFELPSGTVFRNLSQIGIYIAIPVDGDCFKAWNPRFFAGSKATVPSARREVLDEDLGAEGDQDEAAGDFGARAAPFAEDRAEGPADPRARERDASRAALRPAGRAALR